MQQSLDIPPHLKRVATLPCEMFMEYLGLMTAALQIFWGL